MDTNYYPLYNYVSTALLHIPNIYEENVLHELS